MTQKSYTGNKKQIFITVLCLFMCLCTLLPHLATSDTAAIEYPLKRNVASYNAYVQQFDAFLKGQLNIDFEPTEELLNLENPYDWQQRKSGNVGVYLWDRALYDGKYYSYFGIAPIITVFLPYYILTGNIPSSPVTCAILAVIGMVSLCFALIGLIKYFKLKVSFLNFILSLFAVEMGSLIPMLMSSSDMYYIASTSAVSFSALFLALFFGGMNCQKKWLKNLLFALCSTAFVLIVMSRPTVALCGILIIPTLIKYFFKSELNNREKVISLLCFGIPIIIGAVTVCTYNYLRFDSIFEFGAKYQLTVYDVSKYVFSSSLIFPCIYHYFIQTPKIIDKFPFIDVYFLKLKNYGVPYLYVTSTLGAFSFSSNAGFFGIASILAKQKKYREQKFTYLLAFAFTFGLAFINICMGGVNIRYFADFQFIFILFSALILLEIPSFFTNSKKIVQVVVKAVVSLLFIGSAVLGTLLIFENERNYILKALLN